MFKILLDECIDYRLARHISDHTVKTVPDAGWAGLSNGKLLTKAQNQFDVFITVDRHLPEQQNLSKFKIAVIILRGRTNRLQDLLSLIPGVLTALRQIKPGQTQFIGS